MKYLFLVHCGFYDKDAGHGVFESHTNFFVVARDVQEAKAKAKENPAFKARKMHIDGLQKIKKVDGFNILPQFDTTDPADAEKITSFTYRELKPKKPDEGS